MLDQPVQADDTLQDWEDYEQTNDVASRIPTIVITRKQRQVRESSSKSAVVADST